MKNSKLAITGAVLGAVVIAALFYSVQEAPKSPTSEQQSFMSGEGWYPNTVKVGHLVALDMAPTFVAKEMGYFEEQGLDVETVFFSNPGDNNAALSGGSVQININPFTLPYLGNHAGVPMRIISSAGGLEIIEVVIQGEYGVPSITSLAEWVSNNPDKKLRVGTLRGDTLDMIIYRSFLEAGLTYDDFEMVWFSDLLAMVQSFKSGQIDILSHIKPYTTDLVMNHEAKVLTNNDEVWGEGTPNTTLVVLDGFANDYPETVKAYLRAVQKGFQLMVDDPKKAAEVLVAGRYYQTPGDVLLFALENQPKKVVLIPNVEGMMTAINDMVAQGYMDAPSENVVRLEFLEAIGAQ